MKILVIGSGGREHALVDALSRSPKTRKIYAAPGNGGIREQAELVAIPAENIDALVEFARREKIDLTVVGPETPLSKGVADLFQTNGLPIVGPCEEQALLESSKSFTKRFCREHHIPTARFWECSTSEEAYRLLEDLPYPVVVKADGLAAGKGVVVASNRDEARSTVQQFMEAKTLGAAGTKLVFEDFLSGEEASFLVFADGLDFHPMVLSQDHKRRFDGDTGPNTGGMGAYSVDTILSPSQYQAVVDRIIRPALGAANTYSGILYAGLMLTEDGPKLLEFNVRFGDPETQVILPRLKTDLVEVFLAMAEHRLGSLKLEWRPEAAATVVLVSSGYPGKVDTGKAICGLEEVKRLQDVKVFHAGTRWEAGTIYTAGGRVLNVTAWGGTLAEALERAYFAAEMIEFDGKDYRKDIGKKGLRQN